MSRNVKLVSEHTHAGKKYQAGETVEMSDEQAEWYASTVVAGRQAVNDKVAAILAEPAPAVQPAAPKDKARDKF